MKTMNYLITILLVFMIGSCSNETPMENEDLAAVDSRSRVDQENEETQEVFALDLHQYYMLGQITDLKKRKSELERIIESEGGDENLLTALEAVKEELEINFGKLEEILELTCNTLKLKFAVLSQQHENGIIDATKELLRIKRELGSCGIDVDEYFEKATVRQNILSLLDKDDGGDSECIPSRSDCPVELDAGRLLINFDRNHGSSIQVQVLTIDGRVRGKGEVIGQHPDYNSMEQAAIDLEPMEIGVIELKTQKGSYSGFISVRR